MSVRRLVRPVACSVVALAVLSYSSLTEPTRLRLIAGGETLAAQNRFGPRTPGVVFVTSQGLYYDTFVVRDPLPPHGRFQLIEDGQTEFGPGDPGYLGGRWWEDTDGNGIQDPDDHYFLCPLLPPGRQQP